MQKRSFELMLIVAITCIAVGWSNFTSLKKCSPSNSAFIGQVEAKEYEVLDAALDFLWTSDYGISGDFLVLENNSAVPFPGTNIQCPFYEPPPAKDPHESRIERLHQNVDSQDLESALKEQNGARVVWDLSKLDVQANVRFRQGLPEISSSGEFYNQNEKFLKEVGGRALLEISRPGIKENEALVFIIDHCNWPSNVLLLFLSRNSDGSWTVTSNKTYPQSSHCDCGP